MMSVILTAETLIQAFRLAENETTIVPYTRFDGRTPLQGRYRIHRTRAGLRVACPACGQEVTELTEHPTGRGMVCGECRARLIAADDGG